MIIPAVASLAGELVKAGGSAAPTATTATAPNQLSLESSPTGATGTESGSFGGALTEAISSLEQSQASATSASQALATGKVSNPESAVVTVEDAKLAMELASTLRTKSTEAINSIFQTQV